MRISDIYLFVIISLSLAWYVSAALNPTKTLFGETVIWGAGVLFCGIGLMALEDEG